MHIFFINGPPGSGKDTVADMISRMFGAHTDKFARTVKEKTHALYGFLRMQGGLPAPVAHDFFEGEKEIPSDLFHGLSPRQAYIQVSETYFKPVHGKDIFGQLLADSWEDDEVDLVRGLFAISDSGFIEEAQALLERFPNADATVLQLHRDGCDFSEDSRGYIELYDSASLEPRRIRTEVLHNNGNMTELCSLVASTVSSCLGQKSDHRYALEVQLPGADVCGNNPQWVQFGTSSDEALARAKAESARRSSYSQRLIRIIDRYATNDLSLGERYIYPGDDPVYVLDQEVASE